MFYIASNVQVDELALAKTLHGSSRIAPSIHCLRLGLLGSLIPFAKVSDEHLKAVAKVK
jgi:hypothetical protein